MYFPALSGVTSGAEEALQILDKALDVVVVAGAWRYFWFIARARREAVVAWMATVLAAVAVGMDLVSLGMGFAKMLGWTPSPLGPSGPVMLVVGYTMLTTVVVWNVVAAGVFWPLVGRMAWRARV